jgi:Cysteine-rich secretory protein family
MAGMKLTSLLLSALLLPVVSMPSMAQDKAVSIAEPVLLNISTVDETNALVGAINGYRAKLGLAPLAVDADLSQRAANSFPDFANAQGVVDVTAIRRDFAATDVAVLRGVVTHRGAKSGAEFPKYWAKDERWNAVMIGDFTHMGAATVKRSDGKLVAFLYLIRK